MAKPYAQMSQRERDGRNSSSWKKLRAAILQASDVCWMCGRPGADTVDHIVRLADGGDPQDLRNLRPAHGKRQSWGCPGNYGRRSDKVIVPPTSRDW